jgi:hypothetical protein
MRYYSKEHNRLMLSPKVTKPEMKIGSKYDLGFTYDHEWFIRDLEAYNTWLSSSLEIIGEHEYVDGQEVVDSAYEIDYVDDGIDRNGEKKYKEVAIPKKEKDFEPSNEPERGISIVYQAPQLLGDSVASHSSTPTRLLDNLKGAVKDIDLIRIRLAQGSSKEYLDIKLYELTNRIFSCMGLLNNELNVQVSDTTEADSSNPV